MKRLGWVAVGAIVGSTVAAVVVHAAGSSTMASATIPYHGTLLQDGTPVDGVTINLHALLYSTDNPADANYNTVLWQETQTGVPVNNGHFVVTLGTVTSLPSSALGPGNRYLAIGVDAGNGEVMLGGRQLLGSAPFAWRGAPGQDFVVGGGRVYDKTGYAGIPGAVTMYAGGAVPTGWLLCDGSAVSRTQYADLFAAIGTTYGSGDGSTTFNLPDFRGIFPRGSGANGQMTMANGTAYSSSVGSYKTDSFQAFGLNGYVGNRGSTASGTTNSSYSVGNGNDQCGGGCLTVTSTSIIANGYGAPRYGAETAPASLGVNFIIKY